ncbi:MAG: glycosyltransferase [Bacteroidaceae bacterium]|nr:glycosyltransferase [Bacteroidaceae bacterium]
MLSTPKISVIMGIYNCASTLQEALDSLYAQTFKDFEIIMCDDGSEDETYVLAYENQKHYPNIKLLKNAHNMGLNQTLNNCLAVAKGEYIARMDGDDLCDETRFEKQVKFLDSHPEYAIVSCAMIQFDEKGEFSRTNLRVGEPTKEAFVSGPPFCHAPCMVRKEAYDAVNGYTVDRRLLRVEDYHLWMKMFAKGYRGWNMGEYLYYMRDDRNATRRRTFKSRLNGMYACRLAYQTLHFSTIGFLKCYILTFIKGILPTFLYEYFHKK